mmetsp:Transcript_25839/g.62406  ORF Transcript_25839/g.62406 Transcript_25839/m.62406 type:complete len:90 (+) Transcript_25839:551-820(+)
MGGAARTQTVGEVLEFMGFGSITRSAGVWVSFRRGFGETHTLSDVELMLSVTEALAASLALNKAASSSSLSMPNSQFEGPLRDLTIFKK